MKNIQSLINQSKVIVCVGSGGVGKTSVAAATALLAAQSGKKVLVLTIDPAKRLATTLGISEVDVETKVQTSPMSGELYASVIDSKKTFDNFVMRAAEKFPGAEKILNNKLYLQLSTTLSGSQEFTALEKLYSCYESQKYDLIVLDTPPTKHAIDFLLAPQKISSLFEEGIAKWFREPELGRGAGILSSLLQTGTKKVFTILESLTGSEFIKELSEFFFNIEKWQAKLHKRTSDVHRLLVDQQTAFLLVTSLDEAKLKEAEYFSQEINKGGYHLEAVVVNRACPSWLEQSAPQFSGTSQDASLQILYLQMREYFEQRLNAFSRFAEKFSRAMILIKVPEFNQDISDVKGLEKISDLLRRTP